MTTWWASFIRLMSFPLHANNWHLRQNNFTLSCCFLSFSDFLEVSFIWRWWTAFIWRSKIFKKISGIVTHYKINWRAHQTAKWDKFNAQYSGYTGVTFFRGCTEAKCSTLRRLVLQNRTEHLCPTFMLLPVTYNGLPTCLESCSMKRSFDLSGSGLSTNPKCCRMRREYEITRTKGDAPGWN